MPPWLIALGSQTTPATSGLLSDPASLVAIGGCALVVVYFLFMRQKALTNSRGPAAVPGRVAARPSAEREVQALLSELEEMARDLSGQFDARATRLEALIREADQKTCALNAAVARARVVGVAGVGVGQMADRLIAQTSSEGHESGLAALTRHREIYQLADSGDTAPAIAQKLSRPAGEVELILALRDSGGI